MAFPDVPPDLDDYLEGPEPDWDGAHEVEPIPHEERANQLLRRLGRAEEELARDTRRAVEQIEQIRRWADARHAIVSRRIDFLRDSLAAYQQAIFERTGLASLQLPAGTLESTKAAPEWRVNDEDALLGWARDHAPTIIRTKREVDRVELKRLLTVRGPKGQALAYGVDEDGVRPPGLIIDEHAGERRYRQKPAGRPPADEEN